MNAHSGFEDLQDRILELEKQNRRFKRLGSVALIIAAVIVVMGQAPSEKTVEANEFVLKDWSGKVRMKLSMQDVGHGGGMPQMVFLDTNGNTSLELDGSAPGLFGGGVGISDEQGRRVGTLFADSDGGNFWVSDGKAGKKTSVWLAPGDVDITDAGGFEAVLGITDLVTPKTGETHKTSAASIVLLDKKKNVIWKAP
jgi:hypothetical protein